MTSLLLSLPLSNHTDIAEVVEHSDHKELKLRFHAGQKKALASKKRFVIVLAGTQSGKTSFGPYWLYKEIQQRGPGDYLIATPTFSLLELKLLPEFRRLFEDRFNLGRYKASPIRIFNFSEEGEQVIFGEKQAKETKVFFGHAQDPESLESATFKGAWLDEAGQKKFKRGSWEAIQRRLSLGQGRVLITTTPYVLGWLKSELHDPAIKGDEDIELVQFESIMNPCFPQKEFDRVKRVLPKWKFNMMYRGIFDRPAGMIYDCFSEDHKVPRFTIPTSWTRYLGLDFGGVNTACVYLAHDPDKDVYFIYKVYFAGERTAKEHADSIKRGSSSRFVAYGGSKSEGQWRSEFNAGGLYINEPPVSDVEVGIDRVYGLWKEDRLFVFEDLTEIIDEIENYSRVLDDLNEPTEKIQDKETFHRLDGLRYICSHLNRNPSWLAF